MNDTVTNPPSWLDRVSVTLGAIIGLMFLANGAYMLINPEGWYWAVETVPDTGPFNQHFVRDIALMYLLSGAAVVVGVVRPEARAIWWTGAAGWHLLHSGLHTWEVLMGICTPAAYAADFVSVVLPSLVLGLLAWRASRP